MIIQYGPNGPKHLQKKELIKKRFFIFEEALDQKSISELIVKLFGACHTKNTWAN